MDSQTGVCSKICDCGHRPSEEIMKINPPLRRRTLSQGGSGAHDIDYTRYFIKKSCKPSAGKKPQEPPEGGSASQVEA